jgi:prepilin-type N-terminal cleavage/methylation domain-containing protein
MDTVDYGMTSFRKALCSEDGFTLAELLAAVVIISIGLVAVGAGFSMAISGVEVSRQQTTASFLAEQRIEQIKAAALGSSLVACMGFANITAGCFPAQAYGTIANAPRFRSTVTITDCPAIACVPVGTVSRKRVEVEVFYQTVSSCAISCPERSVRFSTLMSNHT